MDFSTDDYYRSQLFTNVADPPRVPNRPLGKLSDFVVEDMPEFLKSLKKGKQTIAELKNIIESSAKTLNPDELGLAHPDLDVANLDLTMLISAITHSNGEPGDYLTGLTDQVSFRACLLPTLTYEGLVLNNPYNDMRTFADGDIGLSERDFDNTHRYVENKHSDPAIDYMLAAITALIDQGENGIEYAAYLLEKTGKHLEQMIEYLKVVGFKMPREHFAAFRPFFMTDPVRKYQGPSAAFSCGIPTIETLTAGENIHPERLKLNNRNKSYFPRKGRKDLATVQYISDGGFSLASIYNKLKRPPELFRQIDKIAYLIREFRGYHIDSVNYQIPNVQEGTSGQTGPIEFLRRIMDHDTLSHIR